MDLGSEIVAQRIEMAASRLVAQSGMPGSPGHRPKGEPVSSPFALDTRHRRVDSRLTRPEANHLSLLLLDHHIQEP
jgi:hypothetical protein